MNCGYGEKLALYFYGEAGPGLGAEVEAHLKGCASCRAELDALARVSAALPAPEGPGPAVLAAVMAAARAASRGVAFGWREALLSGAMASALAGVFAFSGPAGAELAWNSGLDSGLDSVEYSVYQEQDELSASAGDWDYRYSELEDEGLNAADNA